MKVSKSLLFGFGSFEKPWQFYFLRKKQKAEHALAAFLKYKNRYNLSPTAQIAINHGVIGTKGKRVRPVLTHLVHDLVGGSNPFINEAAILAELPHRGSLLEDDIDDNARQRDGKPPAFLLFGKEATQEACQFLYTSPLLILNSLPLDKTLRQRMINQYTRLAQTAREGQKKDVAWGKDGYIPTVDEYLQMCEEKCAAFEYAIRVGAEFGEASTEQTETLVYAGNRTATAFQLIDDLLCLRKGSDDFGSDVTEGKKTLPVIHVTTQTPSPRLQEILSSHTDNPAVIIEAVQILEERGGIDATQSKARELTSEAISLLKQTFPDSKYRRILFAIIDYGINRNE